LAGPVVAAAVVFAPSRERPLPVADSKKLTASRREALDGAVRERALAVSLGQVEVEELDRIGVYAAGLEAMRRAVVGLSESGCETDYLLVDARTVPDVDVRQMAYTKADAFIYSVAAASIVAKVHRDSLMRDLDEEFPGYGFGRHMGYGTAAHLDALDRLGPCRVHRRSFDPVRRLLDATACAERRG
jgi:ribonuclease HII